MAYIRKYYLHRRVKKAQLKVQSRQICITNEHYQALPDNIKAYVDELRDKYRYNIQLTI